MTSPAPCAHLRPPTTSAPKHGPGWIGLLAIGLPLVGFGNLLIYTASTSPSVDVGAIVNGILFLFGLGALGVGLPLTIAGLVIRLRRPPPTPWGGLNGPM